MVSLIMLYASVYPYLTDNHVTIEHLPPYTTAECGITTPPAVSNLLRASPSVCNGMWYEERWYNAQRK